MIIGIGTDIIEIKRISDVLQNHPAFINKFFSKDEVIYLQNRNLRPEFVAGRFAAKEAIVKAMGTGFRGFEFKDIEIENNVLGKPMVTLKGKAKVMASKYGDYKIHLSISHGVDNAIAYAILEGDKNENRNCSNT